jgi:hypothetical protein
VSWWYDSTAEGGSPAEFVVRLTVGTTPSSATPASTIAYQAGVSGYGCTLSGLSSNTQYTIAVQAIGALNSLPGEARTVGLDYRVAPLSGVDSLVALPTP